MTTIAYHHKSKTLSCDGRESMGNEICTDSKNKIEKRGDVVFAMAGDSASIEQFVNTYPNMPKLAPNTMHGIIIDGKQPKWVGMDGEHVMISDLSYNAAAGSGSQFALAAMDFGKDSKQAVKYATTRDSNSGGRIRTVKL